MSITGTPTSALHRENPSLPRGGTPISALPPSTSDTVSNLHSRLGWNEFKYTKNKKEKTSKNNKKINYYNEPIKLEYVMPDDKMDKIEERDFDNFVTEHQVVLESMYELVSSINSEIEKEYFYKWSYLKTNLDYSIKEILKYNKKVYKNE